ncbi:phage portal protein [uncultured Thomasclavelia sp.]|uniref:phage portal protein n=1 Tax=uncultured Thomasclavelia sp. TaxID=3025759 RepID=UPI0026048F4B|nr:phage portal protein [uncultured Thomasclavelia sp.]
MQDNGFKSIQKATGLAILIPAKMRNALRVWKKAYENESDWLTKEVESLNLPSTVANEIARLTTLECEIKVSGSPRAKFIDEQLEFLRTKIKNTTELACALGGIIFKPYYSDGKIMIDYVPQDEVYPFKYDGNGKITGAIFPTYKIMNDRIYTRLEIHDFTTEKYVIQNKAFVSKNTRLIDGVVADIGYEIPLTAVEEWADLDYELIINGMDQPLFSSFMIPIANNIDRKCPLGMSVYSKAIKEFKKADKQWARIDWEYDSKETALDVDENYLATDMYGSKILPDGKKRLYRTYSGASFTGENLFKYFSPEIRDQSFFNGLDKIFKRIEYNCNLAYGTISDPMNTDKTATEIKTSKQRSYQLVKDIQGALQSALEDLIVAMDEICEIYNLEVSGNCNVTFKWDDSIVIDAETEKLQDMQEVNNGLLPKWKYKMKWQGLTEEQAKAELQEDDSTPSGLIYSDNSINQRTNDRVLNEED